MVFKPLNAKIKFFQKYLEKREDDINNAYNNVILGLNIEWFNHENIPTLKYKPLSIFKKWKAGFYTSSECLLKINKIKNIDQLPKWQFETFMNTILKSVKSQTKKSIIKNKVLSQKDFIIENIEKYNKFSIKYVEYCEELEKNNKPVVIYKFKKDFYNSGGYQFFRLINNLDIDYYVIYNEIKVDIVTKSKATYSFLVINKSLIPILQKKLGKCSNIFKNRNEVINEFKGVQ